MLGRFFFFLLLTILFVFIAFNNEYQIEIQKQPDLNIFIF